MKSTLIIRSAESVGVQSWGDYIFTAADTLGFQVFKFPGVAD